MGIPARRGTPVKCTTQIFMCQAEDDAAAALLAAFLDSDENALEWDDNDERDDGADEVAMLERARAEEWVLRDAPALPLPPPDQQVETLTTAGVVRVANALSAATANALRAHVLDELRVLSDLASDVGCGSADSMFSSVLSPTSDEDDESASRRWDLRLRLTPVVRGALRELMAGSVGELLAAGAGDDAELFELAALVSAPGSEPQPLHSCVSLF